MVAQGVLCAAIFCLTILVLRIRASIIVALDGFFDPLGKSLGRMWNKEDVTAFDGATADKSTFDNIAGSKLEKGSTTWSSSEHRRRILHMGNAEKDKQCDDQ